MAQKVHPTGEEAPEAFQTGAMMLIVDAALWEALVRQSSAEGRAPGDVLSDAFQQYMDRNPVDDEDPLR